MKMYSYLNRLTSKTFSICALLFVFGVSINCVAATYNLRTGGGAFTTAATWTTGTACSGAASASAPTSADAVNVNCASQTVTHTTGSGACAALTISSGTF